MRGREVGGRRGGGGRGCKEREVQEGGVICIHIAYSLCCTAETHNIVKQQYPNFFKKKRGYNE